MVKDLRTNHETGNVDAVLDGELAPFMEAWLSQQAEQNASEGSG
jgi:peptide chain release factor 2